MSKSDPMVVVYSNTTKQQKWV